MCIRYIDFVDDEAHVAGFLSAVTKKIKKLPRVRHRVAACHRTTDWFRTIEKRRYWLSCFVGNKHRSISSYVTTIQWRRGKLCSDTDPRERERRRTSLRRNINWPTHPNRMNRPWETSISLTIERSSVILFFISTMKLSNESKPNCYQWSVGGCLAMKTQLARHHHHHSSSCYHWTWRSRFGCCRISQHHLGTTDIERQTSEILRSGSSQTSKKALWTSLSSRDASFVLVVVEWLSQTVSNVFCRTDHCPTIIQTGSFSSTSETLRSTCPSPRSSTWLTLKPFVVSSFAVIAATGVKHSKFGKVRRNDRKSGRQCANPSSFVVSVTISIIWPNGCVIRIYRRVMLLIVSFHWLKRYNYFCARKMKQASVMFARN